MLRKFVSSCIGHLKPLTVAALCFGPTLAMSATVPVHTAELPPFVNSDNTEMPGITVEMLREAAKRANVEIDISYSPWKRAQSVVHATPQTIVLPPARTSAREEKYDWIAKLLKIEFMFFTNGAAVNSYEDAKALGSIAVLRDSAMMHILTAKGFTNLTVVNDLHLVVNMLKAGRVDAWFEVDHMAHSVLKTAGVPRSTFAQGEAVLETDLWVASNHEFDEATAASLAAAVEEMVADGTRDAIISRYVD